MPILVMGLSHHTASVAVRERFAFAQPAIPTALARLRSEGLAEEAVILSTCNRVELYVATALDGPEAFGAIHSFLTTCGQHAEPVQADWYHLSEPQSLEHLFKVASGLDSMVLGETEILGQLKQAYDLALQNKHTGSRLNKAFQKAFNVAKQIRTETQIQRGSVSVASVAVELADKIFNSLTGCCVMVIGAGDTSEKTARAFLSRGAARLLVTNRTLEKAVTLAHTLGGEAVPFDAWERTFAEVDIVVSSTAAKDFILDRVHLEGLMRLRKNRALLLIDIAVPRDIDPAVNVINDVYLYNIDDLQAIADEYLQQRRQEVARCEGIIREKVKALLTPRPASIQGGEARLAYGR